jgi:hypothetical protein
MVKAIEMKMSGNYSNREFMDELSFVNLIQNELALYKGEQPIRNQYTHGLCPEGPPELEQ